MKFASIGGTIAAGAAAGIAVVITTPEQSQVTISGAPTVAGPTSLEVDGQIVELEGVGPTDLGALQEAIERLAGHSTVHCSLDGVNNGEARCFVGGIDMGRWLVSAGIAPASNTSSRYVVSQVRAQLGGRGIWESR